MKLIYGKVKFNEHNDIYTQESFVEKDGNLLFKILICASDDFLDVVSSKEEWFKDKTDNLFGKSKTKNIKYEDLYEIYPNIPAMKFFVQSIMSPLK